MALVIGLTGTIAAGKSSVAQVLVREGGVHCDVDKLAHTLYAPGTLGFERVVREFGEDIVGTDGAIDRKRLGAKVLGDRDAANRLTVAMGSITHAVKSVVDDWRANLGENQIGVLEAIGLMGMGWGLWCDQTWLITTPDAVAEERLVRVRGMTSEQARVRIQASRPPDPGTGGCDWLYENDGSPEAMAIAVRAELVRVLSLRQAGALERSKVNAWWPPFIAKHEAFVRSTGQPIATDPM